MAHRKIPGVVLVCVVCALAGAMPAFAQSPAGSATQSAAPPPAWSFRLTGNMYFLPDEENYLQPTFVADRDALHLESRYRYEDAGSTSVFAGWNLEFGETVKLELTPMFGGLFGRVNGVIPAIEGTLTWSRLEIYSEGEYVIDVSDTANNFYYAWSELSFWATDWLRAGGVFQRTRVYQTPREAQRGFLIGASGSRVEGTFYFFNPGSDDHFYVASVGVKF